MFNNLRQGGIFYILHKGGKDKAPSLRIGQITQKSDPVTAAGVPPQSFGIPMETFTTIEVTAGEEKYKFEKLSSNEQFRFYPAENTFITDSRDIVEQEYENQYRSSLQALETMPYHQSVVDSYDSIKCQLNPQRAKEREQEQKIGALEGKINGIEGALGNIQDMLSKVLNNGGSRKSSNDK